MADKPAIREAIPVLRVADVTRSMRWYESILGYTPHPFFEEPYVFCVLEGDRTRIMLRRHPGYQPDPAHHGSDVYVTLTGNTLRHVYARLQGQATVVRELQHMPYGDCEFEIADPDGHVVCISELLDDHSGIPDVRED